MNCFALFYQSLVLFAVYRSALGEDLKYELHLQSVRIDGHENDFGPTSVLKFANDDEFVVDSPELGALCEGDKFDPLDIEIVELVDRWMRFSYLQPETYLQLYFNVIFSSNEDLQLFFRDIRSPQLQGHWMKTMEIKRIFRHRILRDAPQNGASTLTPFSRDVALYVKHLERDWFADPKSFNFVRIVNGGSQEADLILQSRKFNISLRSGNDKYVLCPHNVEYSYVLRFDNASIADEFVELVKNDVDDEIPCSNDWLTPELMQQVDSASMYLPHLPYLRDQQ